MTQMILRYYQSILTHFAKCLVNTGLADWQQEMNSSSHDWTKATFHNNQQ